MSKVTLKEKTIVGVTWTFIDLIGNQGIQFILSIILARILSPKDFGLLGMITVFIVMSQAFVDSGLTNALIRKKDVNEEEYSTVFYFNIIIALTFYLIIFLFSDFISNYFSEEKLSLLVKVLSLVLIVDSLGLIQRTILSKKLDFKTQTKIGITSSIFSGVVAVVLALEGAGVWSLVAKTLIMQIVQTTMLFMHNKWIPLFRFNIKAFKELFSYSWKILATSMIGTLYQNIYYIVIGKRFSIIELGLFTRSKTLRDLISISIISAIQKVTFPVLSELQDEKLKLREGYRKIMKSTTFILFPVMVGLIVIADSLFIVLYGEKWVEAIPYFRLLCMIGMVFPLYSININILQVKGRTDLLLYIDSLIALLGILFIIFPIVLGCGIMGLLWAALVHSIIAYWINAHYSKVLIDYSVKDQIKDILPYIIISCIMGLCVHSLSFFIYPKKWILLLGEIISGVVVYFLIAKTLKLSELEIILSVFKKINILRNINQILLKRSSGVKINKKK